jgi:riboflavin synthase
MFSGIIEEYGTVTAIEKDKENVHFTITCSFTDELKVDQSLSHNGVCLTVVEIDRESGTYKVTAIKETILKSNLGFLQVGSKVNLERSVVMNGRLDGHIVQGHVDQTAVCTKVEEAGGSWYYTFEYDFDPDKARQGYMTVEKGSVSVNGVSLTVVNSMDNTFQVAIIPYTYEVTNFHTFKEGTVVNIEFDIIGKYLSKLNTYNR